ncbi:MAG: hypothetical protein QMC40_05215 [Vicingaceae bacterium]
MQSSADEISNGVQNLRANLRELAYIVGYIASDLMSYKLRSIVRELIELGDTVKAVKVQGKIKLTKMMQFANCAIKQNCSMEII